MTDHRDADILSFGEALIDFLPQETGRKLRDVTAFTPRLGGAPANLAFAGARLGRQTALQGKIGQDEFGHMALRHLASVGVRVDLIQMSRQARTGLTFVEVNEEGERRFLFYRSSSADMTLTLADVDLTAVQGCRVVHTGTNLLMFPPAREANLAVLDAARAEGALVSMDANLRPHLWPDRSQMIPYVMDAIDRVDVLKVNEDEYATLFGELPPQEVFETVLSPRGVGLFVLTLGSEGAIAVTARHTVRRPAPRVTVIDTTGAGDGFLAGMLCALLRIMDGRRLNGPTILDALDPDALGAILEVGCFVGTEVCTAFGAVEAIPEASAVDWSRVDAAAQSG